MCDVFKWTPCIVSVKIRITFTIPSVDCRVSGSCVETWNRWEGWSCHDITVAPGILSGVQVSRPRSSAPLPVTPGVVLADNRQSTTRGVFIDGPNSLYLYQRLWAVRRYFVIFDIGSSLRYRKPEQYANDTALFQWKVKFILGTKIHWGFK